MKSKVDKGRISKEGKKRVRKRRRSNNSKINNFEFHISIDFKFCIIIIFKFHNLIQGLMPDGTSRFSIDGKVVYHFMGCSTFAGE